MRNDWETATRWVNVHEFVASKHSGFCTRSCSIVFGKRRKSQRMRLNFLPPHFGDAVRFFSSSFAHFCHGRITVVFIAVRWDARTCHVRRRPDARRIQLNTIVKRLIDAGSNNDVSSSSITHFWRLHEHAISLKTFILSQNHRTNIIFCLVDSNWIARR